jgi:hypothetical protein
MKPQPTFVYSVVQHRPGRFAAMCHLSVACLRRLYPDARVVLVSDPETDAVLSRHYGKLLDLITRRIVQPLEFTDLRARSYYLKTCLRDLVDGDMLYLDCDTLPIRPFDDLWQNREDAALVQDRNHHCPIVPRFPDWVVERAQRTGWRHDFKKYFNLGVYFLRDTPVVRVLVDEWQQRWRALYALGDPCDQMSFNYALTTVPVSVRELPPAYNAMVTVHPSHARGAKIYHFFAGNISSMPDLLLEHLLHEYAASGEVDWDSIDRCVALDHPWLPPYWPRRLWQTGNRWRALREFTHNRLRPRRRLAR